LLTVRLANGKLFKCAICRKGLVILSLESLAQAANRTIGTKQTTKAVQSGSAKIVFIAEDAEDHVTRPLLELAGRNSVEVVMVNSMIELGRACGIDVGAASAAVIENN